MIRFERCKSICGAAATACLAAGFFVAFSVAAAQEMQSFPDLGFEDTYQVNVMGNIVLADSTINITNAGVHGGSILSPSGDICVNVYVFDPAEFMLSCCACRISRNAVVSLSARVDLIALSSPNSITVKLVATLPSSATGAAGCNPTLLPSAFSGPFSPTLGSYASGM